MTFDEMFKTATGIKEGPYDYQRRMAEEAEFPSLIEVPTGAGKTAAVVLGWLWRRRFASDEVKRATPRRLVYCLPMRVLVEQTRDCAVTWLNGLGLLGGSFKSEKSDENPVPKSYDPFAREEDGDDAHKIRVHLLMGGDVDRDWDMYPERDAILIGTQDMLLSRALNRGYAMSRYRWPVQFGLLNNDCLWVMDEVQLMGDGLATTAQLQAYRRMLGATKKVQSVWMSATINADWLKTVDFKTSEDAPAYLGLSESDRKGALKSRIEAIKTLTRADFLANKDGKVEADFLVRNHEKGSRSLVIVNTVKRAQAIFQELVKKKPEAKIVLLHSRFRQKDRSVALEQFLATPGEHGIIGVSTQVLEAGIDISAKLLLVDLASWAALVQRFGRNNREGEFDEGRIVWIDKDLGDPKEAAPYTTEELQTARSRLATLSDVGPNRLTTIGVSHKQAYWNVLRRKDMLDLFDTTPDLAGADVDVSRFIRSGDEHDIQVFWRGLDEEGPSDDEARPSRDELCPVSVTDFRRFVKGKNVWRWDYLERGWVKAGNVYPGLVLMLRSEDGGYNANLGWTGSREVTRPVDDAGLLAEEDLDSDRFASIGRWQTLAEHTDEVYASLMSILKTLSLDARWADTLRTAARWHDVGKGHIVFRNAFPDPPPDISELWAKSPAGKLVYERRHFRHELASAIAMLLNKQSDLAAYLAASHHGKVRFSIRALPNETVPATRDIPFARGIWDGDCLPAMHLGNETHMPATVLRLSFMALGDDPVTGPSWLARMLALRDSPEVGPFRLGFLEALLRVADWRASAGENIQITEADDAN